MSSLFFFQTNPPTHTHMYLHVQSHLEALSNNSPVSTTQETSGLEAQPPFLSFRHWNWIRSKWNHRIGGKYQIPNNKEPHCMSSSKKIESHRQGRRSWKKECSVSWCQRLMQLVNLAQSGCDYRFYLRVINTVLSRGMCVCVTQHARPSVVVFFTW